MNIAFITTHYPTLDPQCLDTKAGHYWAREWIKAGHRVAVFHLQPKLLWKFKREQSPEEYAVEGVPVCHLVFPRFIPRTDRVPAWVRNRTAARIADRLEAVNPDIVICDFPSGNWDVIRALKQHRPLAGRLFVPVFNNTDLNDLRWARTIARESAVIGVRSTAIARRIRELAPDKPVFVAYSGSPPTDSRPVQAKLLTRRAPRRLLYAGDLIPLKNVDVLLEALPKLEEFGLELHIIGDGPLLGELQASARARQLQNVKFLGRVSRDAVMENMVESDIFVMVSSPESFGMVYIEAMAAGCYVIASRGEGIDGVVTDGRNGALVAPRNADALAEKIREYLLLPPDRRQAILEAAVQTAREYSEEAVARRLLDDIARLG